MTLKRVMKNLHKNVKDLLDKLMGSHEGKESKSYEKREGGKKRKTPPRCKSGRRC